MGNSLRLVLGNSGTPRFPCHLKLGTSAAIDLSTGMQHDCELDDGAFYEYYDVSYTVDESTCQLVLSRRLDKDGNVIHAVFVLHDDKYLPSDHIILGIRRRAGTDIGLSVDGCSIKWMKTNRSVDEWGRVMDTKLYLYGSGNTGRLLVLECIKNSRDHEEANYNAVTVAHYFAHSSGTPFNRTESDIGLSVVAKIRSSNNGKLDITVEGPEQHPSSALFYMFEKVHRTGIWKPTMCPHCADNRRQLSRRFWQSDSEDSDSVPVATRRGSQQSGRSIANGGRFIGNGNGSFIKCKNFNGF